MTETIGAPYYSPAVCPQVMQQTGIDDEQVVLLLEDHQFTEPTFLELINSLLSAGEVPGLYTPEELEPLLAPLRDGASEANFRGTLMQYFASSRSTNYSLTLCKIDFVYIGEFRELNQYSS